MVVRPSLVFLRHGFVNGVRNLLAVPRIYDDTAVQTLSSAGKLGNNESTLPFLLACNVFVGHLNL